MCRAVEQQARTQQELTDMDGKLEAARFELDTLRNGREASSIIEPPHQ